jgi:signal peptidase I
MRNNRRKKRSDRELYEWVQALVYSVLAVVVLFTLVVRLIGVGGRSMVPTLRHGDRLLVLNPMLYDDYRCGEIVVLRKLTFMDDPIVKRVIATEGQTVDIDFTSGIVYVDGVALDEPYTHTPTNYSEGMVFPLVVEKGCVFAMGDNRNNSRDSRDPSIGQIDRREILGKAIFLIFPGTGEHENEAPRNFSRIGALSDGR